MLYMVLSAMSVVVSVGRVAFVLVRQVGRSPGRVSSSGVAVVVVVVVSEGSSDAVGEVGLAVLSMVLSAMSVVFNVGWVASFL